MTDVIRNINSNNQIAGSGSKPTAKSSDDSAPSQKASASTNAAEGQVDLTNSAQKVDQLIANLSSEPIVDRQKVDEIKSALADGRYEVNSSVIADKLIEIDELLK
ncbi:MAG: flagellar biosynthesis anti-sigma factor FlgM [Gammaproteobacteria bacterium]|nr:flagellar biosynthesis anti-sigma factor FlgM [Gammaproteobacteria bacterium]